MKKLYGVTTAMITPMHADETVDYPALESLTEMLVQKSVNCLYPCGTTGEMLRLSVEERQKIIETIVKKVNNRITVYAHVGAATLCDTIALAQHAQSAGADGVGVVTPQFFSCNDREMEEYFVRVAQSVSPDFPVYLYNIPQCSANDLKTAVIEKVRSRCPNVVGIKYSFADMPRTVEYLNINSGAFSVLHGCDKIFASMLAMGCEGTVSGISGVVPEPFVAVYEAWGKGDIAGLQKWQRVCVKFCDILKNGSNMSYFKEGLKLRGLNVGGMRAPQLDIEAAEVQKLKAELEMLCKESGIFFQL